MSQANSIMANIPLMSDQDPRPGEVDIEMGRGLPSYDQATQAKFFGTSSPSSENSTPERSSAGRALGENGYSASLRTPGKSSERSGKGGLFSRHFGEVDEASAVAFAQLHIRLGGLIFL